MKGENTFMKNDIQTYLNFVSKTKSIKLRYILNSLYEKGGLDCIYDYIEIVEEVLIGHIDCENDILHRLQVIEIHFQIMLKEKNRLQETLKAFTQINYYETIKSKLKG